MPARLFNSPEQNAFYHFGQVLRDEHAPLIPIAVGALCTLLGFRFPHGS
ncbi:hypothetical protein OKA04_00820 [Luteolibacter flavescens]|uniref:Uncharacterized protein n=1 Tax=Luteolibacter flavescens TaxID=1859460 RepID=A0ABT3FIZ4_9BACT|nr:hypothetical protein [Luteolibacter flavescens]MCW1883251.1 hypothetical protein [Luteolibacter flavescens]